MNEPYVNPWLSLTFETEPVKVPYGTHVPASRNRPPAKKAEPKKEPVPYGRQYSGQRLFAKV